MSGYTSKIPTITHNDGWTTIMLSAPFNKDLNEQYKARGMRWDNVLSRWWRYVDGEARAKTVEEELLKILGAVFSEVHVTYGDGTTLSHRFLHTGAGAKLLEDLQNVPVNTAAPAPTWASTVDEIYRVFKTMELSYRRGFLEQFAIEYLTAEQISQLGFRLLQHAAQKQKAGTNT